MKLSISLPDAMAQEIRALAAKTERNISWWLQKAWEVSRSNLLRQEQAARLSHQTTLKTLSSMRGILKKEFPNEDSVTLSRKAFHKK